MNMKVVLTFFALFCSLLAYSQNNVSVRGKVTEKETGQPAIGVSIMVKGTTNGTMTSLDGEYELTNVPSDAVLVVSSIGKATQEVPVAGKALVNLVIADDTQLLDQVVVIGYGTARKRDLTGSIVTVKGSEVSDKPAANPINVLQGKIAGVQIVNSGKIGEEPDIRIRGTNSINGVKPLYVVDGLLNDNINFLNPADIQSIEILKDPSSLAIFGVRGANGVILVTTKQAKQGQVVINVNSSVGFKQVADLMELTDARQFRELYNEQLLNMGVQTPFDYTIWNANTDWQREIFQTAFMTFNNVSLAAAGERNKLYMSAGYMYEEGLIRHERQKKYSLNFNDEFKVNDNLKFGFQINGYKAHPGDMKGVVGAIKAAPITPVFNEEWGLYHVTPNFQSAQVYNPLIDVNLRNNRTLKTEYRAVGNIFGELSFLNDFKFRVAYLADYGFNLERGYTPLVDAYNPQIIIGDPIDHLVRETSVRQHQNIYTKIQSDYLLTYMKQLNNHGLTLMTGFTTYYNSHSQVWGERKQGVDPIPDNPRFWYLEMGDPTTAKNSSGQWESATLSFLFRSLYNYKDKYLFNASFRRDGTNAFYKSGNAWQSFGALGGAWVISHEDFAKDLWIVNFLKLKASWGVLGNQNVPGGDRYPSYPYMNPSNSAVFGDNVIVGYAPDYLVDPNIKWETIESKEVGIETRLFDSRLSLDINYYHKNTRDLIAKVAGVSGTVPGLTNVGEIRNNGFEFFASWSGKFGKDWSYTIGGNLTTMRNEVISLMSDGLPEPPSRTIAGYPIGHFFGFKSLGIYQTYEEIRQSPVSKIGTVKPGDIKFADVDGDGFISESDRTIIGNPTPDFTYGVSLNLMYKNFNLGVEMMGVYGNEIFRDWNRNTYAQFNYPIANMDRWHGVGTSNWEPILDPGRPNNYRESTYYIEDGSFFRIRNIQLGYDFSSTLISKVGVRSLRLFANVQNLLTIKHNSSYTPEIGGSATKFGVDGGTYPVPVIWTLGVNLTF